MTEDPRDKIIVAADVNTLDELKRLVEELASYVGCFKIGLELISSVGGPQAVEAVHSLGGKVFYDGKFCDIPNTVAGAARAVAGLGVWAFNVHTSAGQLSVREAVQEKGNSKVFGVTVLTSIDNQECIPLFGRTVDKAVFMFATMLLAEEADGVICSPADLPELCLMDDQRHHLLKVTPGVRPEWAAKGDQKRVATPAEAIAAAAHYLVIGRPITKPPSEIGTPV